MIFLATGDGIGHESAPRLATGAPSSDPGTTLDLHVIASDSMISRPQWSGFDPVSRKHG